VQGGERKERGGYFGVVVSSNLGKNQQVSAWLRNHPLIGTHKGFKVSQKRLKCSERWRSQFVNSRRESDRRERGDQPLTIQIVQKGLKGEYETEGK